MKPQITERTSPASLQHLIDHVPTQYRDEICNSHITLFWKGLKDLSLKSFFSSSTNSNLPLIDHTTHQIIEIINFLFSNTFHSQSEMKRVNEIRWFVSEGLMNWCINLLKHFIVDSEWEEVRIKLSSSLRNITPEDIENGIWEKVRGASKKKNNNIKLPDCLKNLSHFIEKREETFSCICLLKHLRWKAYVPCIYNLLGILERLATIDESQAFDMIKENVIDVILPYLEGCLTFLEMKAATGVVCALTTNTMLRRFVFRMDIVRRMYYFLEEIPEIIEYEFMLKPMTRLLYHKEILNSTHELSPTKEFTECNFETVVSATSMLISWRFSVVQYFNTFLLEKSNHASAYIARYCPLFVEKSLETMNLLPTSRTVSTVTESLFTLSFNSLGRKFLLNSPHAIDIITYGTRCSGYCQQHCMMMLHNLLVYANVDTVLEVLTIFSHLWPVVIEYDECGHLGLKMMTFLIQYLEKDPSRLLKLSGNHGIQYAIMYYRRVKQEKSLSKTERIKKIERAEKFYELGNETFNAGNIEEAITLYMTALETCPIFYPIPRIKCFGKLGKCKWKQGRYDEVVTYCTRALNLCTPINCNLENIYLRHEALRKLGRIGFASQDFHYYLFLKYDELQSDLEEDIERCPLILPEERKKRASLLNPTVKNFTLSCVYKENEDCELHRFTDQDFLDIDFDLLSTIITKKQSSSK